MGKNWSGLPEKNPDVVYRGLATDVGPTVAIYRDGTYTTKQLVGRESERDRLVSIDHDADSIRRKSTTGRGAAAFATAGVSLLAHNNRGVVYLTIVGENRGVQTFKTKNPNGTTLSSLRSLKAAGDSVIAQHEQKSAPASAPGDDVASQIARLADLHSSGALSDEEFAAAKRRLLGQ